MHPRDMFINPDSELQGSFARNTHVEDAVWLKSQGTTSSFQFVFFVDQ
jgi:hypothetical protein